VFGVAGDGRSSCHGFMRSVTWASALVRKPHGYDADRDRMPRPFAPGSGKLCYLPILSILCGATAIPGDLSATDMRRGRVHAQARWLWATARQTAMKTIALLQGRSPQGDGHAITPKAIAPERLRIVCQDQQ
jgi:hypothetical protein